MSESLSLDQTIAKLKTDAQEALKNVIIENKQRFEANLASNQQHLIQKLNPNLIKFNVGGYKFATTLDTLSSIKDSKLHKMVTGRYPIILDAKNRIFIDRNGYYFGYVLDCLRKGNIELPSDSFLSSRVQKEFEFFELLNVGSSGSKNNQKEDAVKSAATGSGQLTKASGKPITFESTEFTEGERLWRFSSETDDLGSYCCPDRITIEASGVDHHVIGDTLLSSGTHQWRFATEEFIQKAPKGSISEGIVTFGVVTKGLWKEIKDSKEYEEIIGFNTMGETFKADLISNEVRVDGPDFVKAFGCKNQEFTLTFNTQTGVLKFTVKGQEKGRMLKINGSAGHEFYPYFHIENARLKLLESRELGESEQDGMDFALEENYEEEGSDSEDNESVLSAASSVEL